MPDLAGIEASEAELTELLITEDVVGKNDDKADVVYAHEQDTHIAPIQSGFPLHDDPDVLLTPFVTSWTDETHAAHDEPTEIFCVGLEGGRGQSTSTSVTNLCITLHPTGLAQENTLLLPPGSSDPFCLGAGIYGTALPDEDK